jgi:hypothetical protein
MWNNIWYNQGINRRRKIKMTREEIDRWYANIPEGKEVEETRVFDVATMKYYTVIWYNIC